MATSSAVKICDVRCGPRRGKCGRRIYGRISLDHNTGRYHIDWGGCPCERCKKRNWKGK